MVDIYCKIFKTKQIKIGYDKNLKLRIDDIYKSINKKTCLVILANPNSPTGTLIKKNDLIKIIKKAQNLMLKYYLTRLIMNFLIIIFYQK